MTFVAELLGSWPSQGAADGDEVVGDDAEADPALHAGIAFVAAAVEAMAAFDHADAALAAGAPDLTSAEPALLLFAPALCTFARAIGNADTFEALGSRRRLVLCLKILVPVLSQHESYQ